MTAEYPEPQSQMKGPNGMKKLQPFHRLIRLRCGGAVSRYHTFPTLGSQSVGEHSHNVAILVLHLFPGASKELLKAALFHDLPEYDTGDTPANVKWRFPALLSLLEEAEDNVSLALDINVTLTDEEKLWLRMCDTLEYLLYALDQRLLGNVNIDIVFNRGIKRLDAEPYKSFIDEKQDVKFFIEILKLTYSDARNGMAINSSVL